MSTLESSEQEIWPRLQDGVTWAKRNPGRPPEDFLAGLGLLPTLEYFAYVARRFPSLGLAQDADGNIWHFEDHPDAMSFATNYGLYPDDHPLAPGPLPWTFRLLWQGEIHSA